MKKIIGYTIIALAFTLAACTDAPAAKKALIGAGYTDISITGYAFTGCSEDDTYHTEFKAKGPTGQPVSGTVCGGIFKGSTIHLD